MFILKYCVPFQFEKYSTPAQLMLQLFFTNTTFVTSFLHQVRVFGTKR